MRMDVLASYLLDNGVPYLTLSFFVPFISSFIIYYLMCKLLPNRLNTYSLLALSLVYTMWYNLRFPDHFGTGYHLFMIVFINAFTYFIVIFLFKGRFFKKLIVWWYFDIIKTLCQAVSYVPILMLHDFRGAGSEWAQVVSSVRADFWMKLSHTVVFILLFLLLGFLSLTIWRKILMRRFHLFYMLFFAFPMGQIYSLANVIHPNMGDWFFGILYSFIDDVQTVYFILSLFGLTISLFACVAALLYVMSHDKRTAIEAELGEAKRVMELEQAKNEKTEERSIELEKIRHDFNNQLASIIQLVRVGEDKTAQDIVAALENEINQTRIS